MSIEESNDEVEWTPEMPFWIDTDGYNDRDRQMFVCGVEFQMLYDSVKSGRGWNQCIHVENASRARMMARKLNRPYHLKPVDDTWTHLQVQADF